MNSESESRTRTNRLAWTVALSAGFLPGLSYSLYVGYLMKSGQRGAAMEFNLALLDMLSFIMPLVFPASLAVGVVLVALHSASSSTN